MLDLSDVNIPDPRGIQLLRIPEEQRGQDGPEAGLTAKLMKIQDKSSRLFRN